MGKYTVLGMSCAACSARVEKAVLSVKGVRKCSVSLLTNSMTVEGTARECEIIDAVKKAGYSALKDEGQNLSSSQFDSLHNTQASTLLKRLCFSLIFLFVLMYLSMGHVMWGFPLPQALKENPFLIGILQMVLSLTVMCINYKFFTNGFKGILHGSANMDTLVSLGSGVSFLYSVYVLFFTDEHFLHNLYFESAAMILALITLGKMLETRSKGKTTNAIKALLSLSPKTATVIRDGAETKVKIEDVVVGDIFIVRAGESIPVDAVVLEGNSAVDESALTGESIPNEKQEGDTVSAATTNCSGYLKCRATRVGENTTLSQIIKLIMEASASKAPIAKIADKVSGVFVPVVIAIAVIVLIIWLVLGQSIGFALQRAISVLVISCPCALGLATPVAIMVGSGKGAKSGILFKTAASLETIGKAQIIALDKTGTVTKGSPEVTDVIGDDELLKIALSLEIKSEHPIAKAIVKFGQDKKISALPTTDFKTFVGGGVSAITDGRFICGGNADFVGKYLEIPNDILKTADKLSKEAKTVIFFAKENQILGIIAVADTVKDDSAKAVLDLKNLGFEVIMLTGDNTLTATAIAEQVGIENVLAEVNPEQKENIIRNLKSQGVVIMVGDGINDAPALTRANIGIAIGAGTDIATQASEVVLVNSKLSDVVAAIRLGRATLKTIYENLFWAFIYNIICIPLAAGAFYLVGVTLNPMIGAAAMSLSSFCVVSNALRLNLCKIYSDKKDKKIKQNKPKEAKTMQKTLIIEGMMCPHCEARVKKLLEELDSVAVAEVSHTSGNAVLTLKSDISNDVLTKLIDDNGYKVLEIK